MTERNPTSPDEEKRPSRPPGNNLDASEAFDRGSAGGTWLEQSDRHAAFLAEGAGEFTAVYVSQDGENEHIGMYSAVADPRHRSDALADPTWNLSTTDGAPAFVQSFGGTEVATGYVRHPDGFEPLVLHRTFRDVRPSYLEISEEFRLYHNMFFDGGGGRYLTIRDDGSDELAVEVDKDAVRVRTRLLRQYQAARQLDLFLFVDSVRFTELESETPPDQEWRSDLHCIHRHTIPAFGGGRPGTRYIGTRVLTAPPIQGSGKWPYEVRDENYPQFLIGHDEDGRPIRHTCRPDDLANYFGANPRGPHYLTAVHFDRAVLQKYYARPELYSIEDGYLRCAALWGLSMDNHLDDRIIVFLGDLGRDLPSSERDYWRSYNIAPDKGMSETGFRRAFLGQFASSDAADLRLRSAYKRFVDDWRRVNGWDLIRPLTGPDTDLPSQIRIPLSDSAPEFEGSLMTLARIFVDSLNDEELDRMLVTHVDGERSIGKLDRWLGEERYPERDRDVEMLRALQSVRSKTAAHRKGSDYQRALTRLSGSLRGREAIVDLLHRLETMLIDLLAWSTMRTGQRAANGSPGSSSAG